MNQESPDFKSGECQRTGDWEVSKVDVYETKTEGAEFDVIAICWCKYSPINSPLKQLPEIQIHQDLQEV
ncbi:hypothetical protein PCC6912_50680 [Chlorogloeopsis fritschii PCC 6912]|uniref:Uncharacterized protein n=1 Tax=Chlorogloeopsis fritschii PCC 6912 TaxID=211165 RepID=A0A3S1ABJ4_CHLFR|nr:hypothetical protein [Chlorogloeopsis fritschii]RUR74890.1 hypothetical protein PCC6912_50680 [Chlorogloeopsis fritschii PCC 6912]